MRHRRNSERHKMPTPIEATDPRAPARPSERWVVDPGAIPGEPIMVLDGDFETGKAFVIEQEDDKGMVLYEAVVAKDGRGLGYFQTLEEAVKAAEKEFPVNPRRSKMRHRRNEEDWESLYGAVEESRNVDELSDISSQIKKSIILSREEKESLLRKAQDRMYDMYLSGKQNPRRNKMIHRRNIGNPISTIKDYSIVRGRGEKMSIQPPNQEGGYHMLVNEKSDTVYSTGEIVDLIEDMQDLVDNRRWKWESKGERKHRRNIGEDREKFNQAILSEFNEVMKQVKGKIRYDGYKISDSITFEWSVLSAFSAIREKIIKAIIKNYDFIEDIEERLGEDELMEITGLRRK